MSAGVMLLVLLGALLHAGWNALVRGSQDKLADTVLIVCGAAMVAAMTLPFMTPPAPASWSYLATSVLVHVLYFILIALAYRDGELSFAYPLMRGSAPVFSAIFAAMLLNESPSPQGWLAILLICAGILLLAGDAWHAKAFSGHAAGFALLNAGVIVCYTLIDGVGARLSGAAVSYTAWMLMLTAPPMLVLCLAGARPRIFAHLRGNWRKGLFGGSFSLASYALALWAMTQAPIGLVAALRETAVIFGLLLAALFLGERVGRLRQAAIAIVCCGAIVLNLG